MKLVSLSSLIIINVIVLCLSALDSSSLCQRAMAFKQFSDEQNLNAEISMHLNETFEQEPRLLSKLFSHLYEGKSSGLGKLVLKLLIRLWVFNFPYLFVLSLIILLSVCLYSQFAPFQKIRRIAAQLLPTKILSYIFTILIALVCLLLLVQCINGFRQGKKRNSDANQIVCKAFNFPKNMVKGEAQYEGIDGLIKYTNKELIAYSAQNRLLKPDVYKLQGSRQAFQLSSLILHNVENSPQNKAYLQQLISANKALESALNYSIPRPVIVEKTYQFIDIFLTNVLFGRTAANSIYSAADQLQVAISQLALIQKLYYLITFVGGFTLACLTISIFVNKPIGKKYLPFFQYFVAVTLLIALFVTVITSILLPAFFWASNIGQYITSSQQNFFEEFKTLSQDIDKKIVPEALSMILPLNRTFADNFNRQLYHRLESACLSFEPFTSKKSTYFYDLFKESLQFIKNPQAKQMIQTRMEDQMVQLDFAESIKNIYKILLPMKKSLQPNGSIWKIDGNEYGKHLYQLSNVVILLASNRLYAIRQISAHSGLLLLILLLASIGIEKHPWQFEQVGKQDEGNEMNNMSAQQLK